MEPELPAELTATDALALMRARRLSPIALVEALLERIAAREPTIEGWACVDGPGALAAAHVAERAWRDGAAGPLCGIPVGIKDLLLTRGLPTTAGFAPLADFDPGVDATAVARLRAAGAIILGKTVTTQFAGRDPSRTRNPWDLTRTASGSSSGSAAVVADRMAPVALGTQTGGSVLRPAAYLGLVGFAPTHGRVSRHGLLPRAFSFDTIGVMSRGVADAALLLDVIAGPDPLDPTTLHGRPLRPRRPASGRPPRLALIEDFLPRVAPRAAEHFLSAVDRLAAAGARVRRARLPVALELMIAIHTVILLVEAAASQSELLPRHRAHYAPGLRAQLEIGGVIPARAYLHAQRLRRRVRSRLAALFSGADALVLPATPDVAPDRSTIGPHFCQVPWTIMGWPAITVPSGLGADGLPLGLQMVGAQFQDAPLLRTAGWVEARLGRLTAPAAVAVA